MIALKGDRVIAQRVSERRSVPCRLKFSTVYIAFVDFFVELSLSVEDTVVEFCRNSLNIDLDPRDISSAQRLRKTGKDTARPIMVRFVSLKVRDRVMRAKKVLRTSTDSHEFLSDHLTTEASQLFFEARTLVREKKLASAWTMNGRVYYKKTTAADEKPTLLLPGCLPN